MRNPSLLPWLAALLWVIVAITILVRLGNASVFLVVAGLLMIALSAFSPVLRRRLGLPEVGAGFTNPRYLRSARITDRLGRLALMLMGLGFVIQGVGGTLLNNQMVAMIVALIAISVTLVIAMIILARLMG
jgi:hypothetical protein